tara:strand:+ start:1863 stop:2117 length:255 start_codon:yes stop_codon:yes gene_type:complete
MCPLVEGVIDLVMDALEGLADICPPIDADLVIPLEGLLSVFGVLWRDVIDPLILSFRFSSRKRRFSTAMLSGDVRRRFPSRDAE